MEQDAGRTQRRLGLVDARTVVQVAGSDAHQVSAAVGRIRQCTGARRFNLNVGCPSQCASRSQFGAVLMQHPQKVAAILQQVDAEHPGAEMSIKCRLGVDTEDSFEFFRSFVEFLVRNSPVRTVVVHARSAILSGLDTKDNRKIPPLKYDFVYRISRLFPDIRFVLNGGLGSAGAVEQAFSDCPQLGGVMVGRWPYEKSPMAVRELDQRYFGGSSGSVREIAEQYIQQTESAGPETASRFIVCRPICSLLRGAMNAGHKELNRKIARILQEEKHNLAALHKLSLLA